MTTYVSAAWALFGDLAIALIVAEILGLDPLWCFVLIALYGTRWSAHAAHRKLRP